MTKPKRIQRKRTLGWRKPDGVINVSRPSKWGNPYVVRKVRLLSGQYWVVSGPDGGRVGEYSKYKEDAVELALMMFHAMMERTLEDDPHALDELKGKDLMCWCPIKDRHGNSVSCHADLLLALANPDAEDDDGDTTAG